MTVINHRVPHTDAPSVHLRRAAVIVLCGLLFFLAMLPPFFTNKTSFTVEQWSQLVQSATLHVDRDCSPFGAMLSCVEVGSDHEK